jgi:hypothetical protein
VHSEVFDGLGQSRLTFNRDQTSPATCRHPSLTHGYTQAFLVGAGFLLTAAVVAAVINIGNTAAAENDPCPRGGPETRHRQLSLLPGKG